MLQWMRCTHNMLHMFLIPLQVYGIKPPKPDTHWYTQADSACSQGPPNHAPTMGPPLFIKTQTKRGCRQEQGAKERLLRRSPPACLVRSVGACGPVCLCRSMGGVWESTPALNDLIETPTRSAAPHQREDGSGSQAARDPPLPLQQFAVWAAQRGGQRSNKCSEMEVHSHGNVVTNKPASVRGCWREERDALGGGTQGTMGDT